MAGNVTDDILGKIEDSIPGAMAKTGEGVKNTIGMTGKVAKQSADLTVKGIVVLISGANFTRNEIMNAFKKIALAKTKDVKFSKQNIDISILKKRGSVRNIDESLKKEVMFFFDKNCKKFGIQYNAMQDVTKKESYLIFFSGKNENIIHQAIAKSYKDYVEAQKKQEIRQERRESARAKLAFFRNCVAARDRDNLNKNKERDIDHPQPVR